jgi:hypothetical protein
MDKGREDTGDWLLDLFGYLDSWTPKDREDAVRMLKLLNLAIGSLLVNAPDGPLFTRDETERIHVLEWASRADQGKVRRALRVLKGGAPEKSSRGADIRGVLANEFLLAAKDWHTHDPEEALEVASDFRHELAELFGSAFARVPAEEVAEVLRTKQTPVARLTELAWRARGLCVVPREIGNDGRLSAEAVREYDFPPDKAAPTRDEIRLAIRGMK